MSDGADIPSSKDEGCLKSTKAQLMLLYALLGLGFWAALWLMVGDEAGLPGKKGYIFALAVLFPASLFAGWIASLCSLPPLLGMLIAGFALRNIVEASGSKALILDTEWSSALKSIALVVILTRAGLGLKLDALKKLSAALLRLIFIPNLSEAVVDAAFAVAFFDMPWTFALALGFIISAVSPAVVVPSLLYLQERRYGTAKGIPTLVLAAASFDDVLSISGFGICIGLAFASSSHGLAFNLARAPLEVVAGVSAGALTGYVTAKLTMFGMPSIEDGVRNGQDQATKATRLRVFALLSFGMLAVFGGRRVHFTGAGALCVIIAGIICARLWGQAATARVEGVFKEAWIAAAQPLLFVLIGSSVSTTYLDARFVGKGVAILLIGLTVRLLASILCVWTPQFTLKERVFIALAWFPKATVQAAIGAVALDTANQQDPVSEDQVKYGQQILTIAVLSIMLTAPIGAAAIAFGGPKLLEKEPERRDGDKEEEEEVQLVTAEQEREREKQPEMELEIGQGGLDKEERQIGVIASGSQL